MLHLFFVVILLTSNLLHSIWKKTLGDRTINSFYVQRV